MRKTEKRGQITIFIIVGILIIIAAALVIYLKEQEIIFRPEAPPVSDEAVPLQDFVEVCIESTAEEAANLVGSKGGYYIVPDEIKTNPNSYLRLSPLENGMLPYWYYLGEERIPPLEFIEDQMELYIEDNLKDCILDLQPFQTQYNIRELGELDAYVSAVDSGIDIEISYPIEITDKTGKKIIEFDFFNAETDYRLKKAYELASSIMEEENRNAKLEDITVDLIALDNEVPYTNLEFSCSKKRWQINDIHEKLKLLLRSNLPLIRVAKTNYRNIPENQPYVLNHYLWDVSNTYYPEMHVSINYDESWPLYIYIRPNKGSAIESNMQEGFDMISWLCLQFWKFTYDIIYPVSVNVYDERSDYTFTFAFDVMVDHNQPNRDNYAISSFEFETNPEESEYCGRRVNEITVYSYENVSGDFESYTEIDGVNLTFTCLKFTCPIGTTEYEGPVGVLTEEFPYCVLGILKGNKQGYKEGKTFISTEEPGEARIYLTPLKRIEDYSVVKHKLSYDGDNFSIGPEEKLEGDEYASISLETLNHNTYGKYPVEDLYLEMLAYADYEYDTELFLTKGDEITGGFKGNWTAYWEDIDDADEIKFHVVYMDGFEDETEQFAFIAGLNDYSEGLEPEIK